MVRRPPAEINGRSPTPARQRRSTWIGSKVLSELAYVQPTASRDAPQVSLVEARSPSDFAAAADLMRAFVGWQHVRHADNRDRIDAYFNPEGFEDELARLPEPFVRPGGTLLVAKFRGEIAGCIALKDLGDRVCEMKRLYLKPEYHGLGLGRMLVSRLIEEATAMGHTSMRLETGPLQFEAQGLYAAFGFRCIRPYRHLPDCLRDWVICMERPLATRPSLRVDASA